MPDLVLAAQLMRNEFGIGHDGHGETRWRRTILLEFCQEHVECREERTIFGLVIRQFFAEVNSLDDRWSIGYLQPVAAISGTRVALRTTVEDHEDRWPTFLRLACLHPYPLIDNLGAGPVPSSQIPRDSSQRRQLATAA
jgi:hypothetical protein